MNKKMWNTISIDGSIPFTKIYELINHSYLEVVKGMSKKLQQQLV
jgi:predicted DNA-binding protein (MmcQ/YjbR family)